MEAYQAENKTLQVLHKVIKDPEPFRVFGRLHVCKSSDLGCRKPNVLTFKYNLKLLPANPIRRQPMVVILLHDLAVQNNLTQDTQNR